MKKTLRYLLSMIAVVSVLSLSAQTPNYGTLHKQQPSNGQYVNPGQTAQLPSVPFNSTSAGYVRSCSKLPSAIETGVVTTYDAPANAPSRPRRVIDGDDDDDEDKPSGWDDPMKDPIGDVMWPLVLMALSYMAVRVARKRKGAVSK